MEGLSTRARKALEHIRVKTPDELRKYGGDHIELCLISIPRCGWNTVAEIMEWCGEPLSDYAQKQVAPSGTVYHKIPYLPPESPKDLAAALADAQATIARLEAALREIAQEPMNGDLMEPIIKRNLATARAALSHGKGGSPNHTGTVTVLNEPITVEVGKVPGWPLPPWSVA